MIENQLGLQAELNVQEMTQTLGGGREVGQLTGQLAILSVLAIATATSLQMSGKDRARSRSFRHKRDRQISDLQNDLSIAEATSSDPDDDTFYGGSRRTINVTDDK